MDTPGLVARTIKVNGWTVSKYRTGNEAEESGYSLINGPPLHIYLKKLRNAKENLDHDLNLQTPKYAVGVVAIQQHIYTKTHKYYIIPL
jgi:hypothetical protein